MNKRNKFIYKSIKNNLKIWIKFSLGKKEHIAGKRFENHTETEVISYIEEVYKSYLEYGELNKKSINNKRVLEIGPGDSFGIAIKLLFDGAKEVICFDKFYATRNHNLLNKAYQILFSKQNKYVFKDIFSADLIPNKPISYYYGKGIEAVKLKRNSDFQKNSFDLIISNQVIQEIYNPKPAFKKMIELLDIGGKMIHHIDFEPYNYFRAHSKKEYEFLTYPEFIYKWMVNKRGMSNRKRVSDYIKILDAYDNISYKILVYSCFLNKKELEKVVIYPDFNEETKNLYSKIVENQKLDFVDKYKCLPIEDFIVGNAYLIIEKNK